MILHKQSCEAEYFVGRFFRCFYFTLRMKFDKLLLLILVCVCATSLCAQDKITIAVVDTHGNALSYPEIIVGTDLHRVGTEKGTLDIPLQLLNSGDTLTVKYLGFKTSRTVLNGAVLSDKLLRIILEESSFVLNSVVVSPSDFSGERYFQEKIKSSLTPYSGKYFFDVSFTFTNHELTEKAYSGVGVGKSRRTTTAIDKSKIVVSAPLSETSKLITLLKRATEISYLMANSFCDKKGRSYFFCRYKGEAGNLECWEFLIKKQKKMPWNLEQEDECRCMVSLDKSGLIKNIKIQRKSSSDHSFSYLLETEFTLFEEQLVPKKVTIDLIPNAKSESFSPLSIVVNYSNFRKRG